MVCFLKRSFEITFCFRVVRISPDGADENVNTSTTLYRQLGTLLMSACSAARATPAARYYTRSQGEKTYVLCYRVSTFCISEISCIFRFLNRNPKRICLDPNINQFCWETIRAHLAPFKWNLTIAQKWNCHCLQVSAAKKITILLEVRS